MRRSGKGYSNWAGGGTCRSMRVLVRGIPFAVANTQRNWSRFRRTSYWLPVCSHTDPASGNPQGADHLHHRPRPGRLRLRRKPVATGRKLSGFMQFEYSLSGKWLELLKQIAPNVTRAAILWDPTIPAGIGQFAVIQSVAPSLGVDVRPVNCEHHVRRSNAPSLCSRASQMAV